MTILQAVAAGLENTEKRKEPKKKADRYFLDGKVADRELKACNICRIVWQKHDLKAIRKKDFMQKRCTNEETWLNMIPKSARTKSPRDVT